MPIPVAGAPGPAATPSSRAPELSVVVPTCGRPDAIVRLLRLLAAQTLPPDRFEVLVTDDGTQPPVAPALAELRLPFHLDCQWQPQRGPAAARNRAIERARAPFLMILNDDAGPASDLLERHLAAQRASPSPRAWLGSFDFAPECSTPFSIAVTRLGVVFPYPQIRRGAPNPGRFFWTCNLSVPRQAVLDAGGFDESFARPICEDVELGYRLEKRGVQVWFLEDAHCLHHHRIDVAWFVRRQFELGQEVVRLWRKHHDPELFPWIHRTFGDEAALAASLEGHAAACGPQLEQLATQLDGIDRAALAAHADPGAVEAAASEIAARAGALDRNGWCRGLFAGLMGWDAAAFREWLAALPPLTTLVPPRGIDPKELERLRLLAGAPVQVVEIPESTGGRPLRSELLARARGERLCLVERGFAPTRNWLRSALRPGMPAAVSAPGSFQIVHRSALAAPAISNQAVAAT